MKKVTLTTHQICTKQPSFSKFSTGMVTPNHSKNSSLGKFINNFIKGMSLLFFPKRKQKATCGAAMTVEAALVVPLFLFFLLNLLGIIEIYSLHGTLTAALREVGRELSVYAYAYDSIVSEEDDSGLEALVENVAFSYLYVKNRVEDFAGQQYLENSPLVNGSSGLVYLESSILQQGDIIDLIVTYQVSPFVKLAGYGTAGFYNRYYGRAWTGYDVTQNMDAGWVYVAENAEVYHINRECTHLKLSIREYELDMIDGLRNESGSKYRACEFCVTGGQERLFITTSGDCYHEQINCIGLKRTVSMMTREEAEKKYRECSRCGR